MTQFRPTFAEINLAALEHNIQLIKAKMPATFLCPMVKANAYGHGDLIVTRALEKMGVAQVGVCLLEEGLKLRAAGLQIPILVFQCTDPRAMSELLHHRLTPVLTGWAQIDAIEALATEPVDVHLKFDTGMQRMGFAISEAPALFERLKGHRQIRLRGLATHLLQSDDLPEPQGESVRQLRELEQAAAPFRSLGVFLHALNSGGVVQRLLPDSRQLPILLSENWGLRPGIYTYGGLTLPSEIGMLKPVMNLKSEVLVFRHLQKGTTVSYGGTWRAQRDSLIGVVPIGYGDGYHRILSNQAEVLFAGRRVPVVGNVCMDYLMVDLTSLQLPKDYSGPRDILLFGEDSMGHSLPAEELAKKAKTISYEIFTSISERVPRVVRSQLDSSVLHDRGSR